MKCKECEESLLGFIRYELIEEQLQLLQIHLKSCAACREELKVQQQMWDLLDKQKQPSRHLKENFMQNMGYMDVGQSIKQNGVKSFGPVCLTKAFQLLWPSKPAGALAYSLILLFSGILSGQQFPEQYLTVFANSQTASPLDYSAISEDRLVQLCTIQKPSRVDPL